MNSRRALILILALIAACTVACQPTPEKEIISFPDAAASSTGAYSREYLDSVMADIDEYFAAFEGPESLNNDKLGQIFASACIMDGYIEVTLTELNEENIALFKKQISDSDAVTFKQGEKFEYLST